ncbi:MAG: hypothetical protein CML23_20410 [Rhizobiaceae bacterium]|nr:hypothetical protein [Rhizobiaceae bacterium]|tara:strand:- start:1779 stop:1997 length:219 start_codon:yes stop_codon:yes gene_type:complete
MPNVSFVQADIERLIRAAKKQGAIIEFDMRSFTATIVPDFHDRLAVDEPRFSSGYQLVDSFAPDGKENWDEN